MRKGKKKRSRITVKLPFGRFGTEGKGCETILGRNISLPKRLVPFLVILRRIRIVSHNHNQTQPNGPLVIHLLVLAQESEIGSGQTKQRTCIS